jgi:hypothetical protein
MTVWIEAATAWHVPDEEWRLESRSGLGELCIVQRGRLIRTDLLHRGALHQIKFPFRPTSVFRLLVWLELARKAKVTAGNGIELIVFQGLGLPRLSDQMREEYRGTEEPDIPFCIRSNVAFDGEDNGTRTSALAARCAYSGDRSLVIVLRPLTCRLTG